MLYQVFHLDLLQNYNSRKTYNRYIGIFRTTFILLTTLQSKVSKYKENHAWVSHGTSNFALGVAEENIQLKFTKIDINFYSNTKK